jgi:hypothetical protein
LGLPKKLRSQAANDMRNKMKSKDIILILTTLLCQSCLDYSSNESSKSNQEDSTNSRNPIFAQIDSTTIKDWRLIEIGKVLPQWPDSSLKLESAKAIDSDVFSVLCTHSDGVSTTTYLFTFNNRKIKDYEIIVEGADQDLSSPRMYQYKELIDSVDNKFVVVNYTQTVIDKGALTNNGEFKDGYNFENVKIKTDSIVLALSILNNGQIRRDTLK